MLLLLNTTQPLTPKYNYNNTKSSEQCNSPKLHYGCTYYGVILKIRQMHESVFKRKTILKVLNFKASIHVVSDSVHHLDSTDIQFFSSLLMYYDFGHKFCSTDILLLLSNHSQPLDCSAFIIILYTFL